MQGSQVMSPIEAFASRGAASNGGDVTGGQEVEAWDFESMNDRLEHDRIEEEIDRTELSSDPFAAAMRATRMPMIITDPNRPDNPIVFANDAFCRLTGYARDEILNRNCRFLQGPKTNPDNIAQIRHAIAKRVPIEIEIVNYKKNNEEFWNMLFVSPVFDDRGELAYFFASQYDNTAVRLAHKALSEKSLEFETLAENVSQLAWMAEPDGHIYWYNRRWYEYTGTTLDAMQGWGWRDVHLPDQVERIVAETTVRWAAGKAWEEVFYLRSASGEYRPFLTRIEPIYDEAGQLLRWLGTNTDIAAQTDAERRLRELNDRLEGHVAEAVAERMKAEDQLRQSQKMEAVGQLTGGVAHDFNNLLTVIRGSTDLLRRPDVPEERRKRYIDAIATTADRATKLTNQLLAFARRQALNPELFDAVESLRAVRDMLGALTGSRIRITLDLREEPCFVNADRSQFDTAIVNMAVNARDAMNGEGELKIKVDAVSGMPAIRAHPFVGGRFATIALTDAGSGIAAEKLDQIFEPFFTTKNVGQGTGLGLSQVFGFAKQSGGDIHVESVEGAGSTFTMYLPLVETPEEADGADPAEQAPSIGEGACILVVEDNAEVGAFATAALAELGYKATLAIDAAKALAELASGVDGFDAVFTDVIMPGMSGIEMGQEIRRLYPNLPVILTSGYSDVLAQNGAHGFELLRKPYSIDALSRVLQKVANRRTSVRC